MPKASKQKSDKPQFKIEKNVPVPIGRGGGAQGKGHSDALRKLEVGDSVVLPVKIHAVAGNASRILGTGNYISRTVENGVRIWRTK